MEHGGIAGSNHSTIKCSYNKGAVVGTNYVGGVVGTNFDIEDDVYNCYNIGTVESESIAGGIVGRNGSTSNLNCYGATIKNCYNIGNIDGTCVGNIVGVNKEQGTLNNCYYLQNEKSAYGVNYSQEDSSAYPKTEDEIKELSNVLNNDTKSFRHDQYNYNNGYPILVFINDIEIIKMPNKLQYEQDVDELDLSGGKVKLKYNYEEYDTVLDMDSEGISVSGFDNGQEGILTLTLLYTDEYGDEFEEEFEVNVVDFSPPELEVSYSTKEMTKETVTATIKASEKIQQVEGWSLSEDETSLSKVYAKNTTETVKVYDLFGNESTASIKIDNIDTTAPQAEINYSTTKLTNQNVTVTIIADEKLKEVEGWTLSSDKTKLTKEFKDNKEERITIYDLVGNHRNLTITIGNIDKKSPKTEISYSTTELTNGNVEVTITANEKIQQVEGWTISSDRKTLIKEYKKNVDSENVIISDLAGNTVEDEITITNIDKEAPELEIIYSTVEETTESIVVKIKANEKIQQVEGWSLDEETNTLTKEFNNNTNNEITIYDLAGNGIVQQIIIDNIVDKNVAPTVLPNTGENLLIISVLIILLVPITVILKIKVEKFKDVN